MADAPQQLAYQVGRIYENVIENVKATYERDLQEREQLINLQKQENAALKEVITLRDAALASMLRSLQEAHAAIDQLRNDKKLLIKEKEKLQSRIDVLEARPEPLPCGLPQLTREALGMLWKWDADARLDQQRQTIESLSWRLRSANEAYEQLHLELGHAMDQIRELQSGRGFADPYSVFLHATQDAEEEHHTMLPFAGITLPRVEEPMVD
jgi:chromosome segregation ATPase